MKEVALSEGEGTSPLRLMTTTFRAVKDIKVIDILISFNRKLKTENGLR
jgi:hypothetical protein